MPGGSISASVAAMRPCTSLERHVVRRRWRPAPRRRPSATSPAPGSSTARKQSRCSSLMFAAPVEVVHLVADAPQRVAGVALAVRRARCGSTSLSGASRSQRSLNFTSCGEQRVELALVLGRRHQEEDAVEIALLRHDPLFAQEVGDARSPARRIRGTRRSGAVDAGRDAA